MMRRVDMWLLASASIIGALLVILAGIATYWIVEPETAIVSLLEWNTCDSEGNVKTQFKPGEFVYSWRKVLAHSRTNHTKVWRIIIADHQNMTVSEYEIKPITAEEGISERTVKIGIIPSTAPLGMYHVRTYATYVLNPLRDATYEILPQVRFEVVK